MQTLGRSGFPKRRHKLPEVIHLQGTPAGFPFGIPGIELVIEISMQQIPQSFRHSIFLLLIRIKVKGLRRLNLFPTIRTG